MKFTFLIRKLWNLYDVSLLKNDVLEKKEVGY